MLAIQLVSIHALCRNCMHSLHTFRGNIRSEVSVFGTFGKSGPDCVLIEHLEAITLFS